MRRALHALAVVIIVVLVVGLYKAKTDASKSAAHVRQLETQISDAQADLRALRAEIAHLESPERVEALAERHLDLELNRDARALPEDAIDTALPQPRERPKQ